MRRSLVMPIRSLQAAMSFDRPYMSSARRASSIGKVTNFEWIIEMANA